MRTRSSHSDPSAEALMELVLRLPDGRPWAVRFSPGIERFIGFYPRLDAIDADGPLLSYRSAGARA
jgi:hypothetical protein